MEITLESSRGPHSRRCFVNFPFYDSLLILDLANLPLPLVNVFILYQKHNMMAIVDHNSHACQLHLLKVRDPILHFWIY